MYCFHLNSRGIYTTLLGNVFKFGFLGCCMAMKKPILESALPFPKNEKLATFDNWLFLIGITKFKLKIQTKPLIEYRRHDKNISTGGFVSNKSLKFKLQYRLYIVLNLVRRIFLNK